jgi:hypothetical protein
MRPGRQAFRNQQQMLKYVPVHSDEALKRGRSDECSLATHEVPLSHHWYCFDANRITDMAAECFQHPRLRLSSPSTAFGIASEPASSAIPTLSQVQKMRWCPAAFSNSFSQSPFSPFSFLHRPCHTSGHGELHPPCSPLACAGRYDVASEKNTSARPPVLIRLTPQQHFLIDRPTVGR